MKRSTIFACICRVGHVGGERIGIVSELRTLSFKPETILFILLSTRTNIYFYILINSVSVNVSGAPILV